ncbi:MAG: hypothetical protein HYY20_11760 [Candidatus Tectomicrobia bacterium]|uniref:Uncharacterized protein n=1 Tax=Tectimicrobiota bacterium TaxID=2528274 RepID=A0A932CQJ3_UNCTE|nr:hypothetical protein [Candidatus Tectomicrobia bacterium]
MLQRKIWTALVLALICLLGWSKGLEAAGRRTPIAYDPTDKRGLIAYHKKGKGLRGRLLDVRGKRIG